MHALQENAAGQMDISDYLNVPVLRTVTSFTYFKIPYSFLAAFNVSQRFENVYFQKYRKSILIVTAQYQFYLN